MTGFKRESTSLARTIVMPLDRGEMSSGENDLPPLTLGMLLPPFLEWARYEMRRSPLTIARYREALNWVIRDIGDVPLATLNVGHVLSVRQKMDQRRCGEARVAAILNALRSFLRFCCEGLRLVTLDPRQIRVPRIPRRDKVRQAPERAGERGVILRPLQVMRVGHVDRSFHRWPWGVILPRVHLRPPWCRRTLYRGAM